MLIKYFEVTSERLNYPAYYAAYSLKDAKDEAHSDFDLGSDCEFKEVDLLSIPIDKVIHSANLEYADAKALANRAIDVRFGAQCVD